MSGVIHIHTSGPVKQARSVAQLAKHLGVSFAASDLQLSVVQLARKVESLEFQVELLRFELRKPMWRRLADRLRRPSDEAK